MPLSPRSMSKKQIQRKLTIYFSAMIVINSFVFWRSAHGIAIGLSDFASFYTAAEILRDGRGHQLYDLNLQEEVQRSVMPEAVKERGGILPFNHPAFEAIVFLPLTAFSLHTAFWIWFSINIGFLFAVIWVLRKYLPLVGQAPFYLWAAGCLAFPPIAITLIQGQDSIVLLFFYCMAFIALRREAEFSAGGWIAAGLFKFQVSLPFIVPLLLRRRWRIIAGFSFVGTLLVIISLATVGFAGLLQYPNYVWKLDHDPTFGWLVPSRTPNLHGLILSAPLSSFPRLCDALLAIFSGILVAAGAFAWRTGSTSNYGSLYRAFAGNLLISVLLSYHILVHDLSVLFLALLLVAENAAGGLHSEEWVKTLTWACVALLWSPLYLILMRIHRLDLLAIVFLILLGTVVIQSPRGKPLGDQAGQNPAIS
jgi:hypothetical protein